MNGNEIVDEKSVNVWRIIEVLKKSKDNDIEHVCLSIQDIPKDRYDEAVDFMSEYYIEEEVICKFWKMNEDEDAVNDWRSFWRCILSQGVSVGAFVLDSKNLAGELAGINVLVIPDEEFKKGLRNIIINFKSFKMKEYMRFMKEVHKEADIHGSNNDLGAAGLAIKYTFRGQKVGVHLLESRDDIGRKYGITSTSTIFTGLASQIQAERAGFITVFSKDYKEILDDNGQPRFPNIEAKSIKVMIKELR